MCTLNHSNVICYISPAQLINPDSCWQFRHRKHCIMTCQRGYFSKPPPPFSLLYFFLCVYRPTIHEQEYRPIWWCWESPSLCLHFEERCSFSRYHPIFFPLFNQKAFAAIVAVALSLRLQICHSTKIFIYHQGRRIQLQHLPASLGTWTNCLFRVASIQVYSVIRLSTIYK